MDLIARLRTGSVLTTGSGTRYRVIEPVVYVAANGSLVPTLLMEITASGRSPRSALMSLGMLSKAMRGGGRHKPGAGGVIDWSRVERRSMTRDMSFLRRPSAG